MPSDFFAVLRSGRRAGLEGASLAVVIGAVILFAWPWRFEAVTGLALDNSSARAGAGSNATGAGKRLLELALQRAYDLSLPEASAPRKFRVDVLRDRRLQLVCQAETLEIAETLCNRIANEAVKSSFAGAGAGTILTPAQRTRSALAWRTFSVAWPALLVGFAWFVWRAFKRGRAPMPSPTAIGAIGARDTEPEWERWSRPSRSTPPPPPLPKPRSKLAPSAHAARQPPLAITKTLVGSAAMPAVAMPDEAHFERPFVQLATSAIPNAPNAAVDELPEPQRTTTGHGNNARRVIYLVNSATWTADPHVLTPEALDQLSGWCDEFLDTARGRVIRVASTPNSRYAKSQVATQLARLAAERKDTRVLLAEGDLDVPALHKVMRVNVPRGFGFSEQLERIIEAGSRANAAASATLLRVTDSFHALLESQSGTPRLFDSPQFAQVIAHERREHDLIVIDGPVVDTFPDAQALNGLVDFVVFVVAAGTAFAEAVRIGATHFAEDGVMRLLKTGDWSDA